MRQHVMFLIGLNPSESLRYTLISRDSYLSQTDFEGELWLMYDNRRRGFVFLFPFFHM